MNINKTNNMKTKSITFIAPLLLMAVFAFGFQSKKAKYHSKTVKSVYKTSIQDYTKEEKLAAFKYMISTGDCSYKGIQLKGKVKVVSSFADIKVEYVSSFPDIKVKKVSSFPDDCGEWQFVTSFPDFEIQEVTSFPDLKVQIVSSFPGMN